MGIKMFLRLIVSTPQIKIQSEMRSTLVASLLVFILIEGSKPVVGGGKNNETAASQGESIGRVPR